MICGDLCAPLCHPRVCSMVLNTAPICQRFSGLRVCKRVCNRGVKDDCTPSCTRSFTPSCTLWRAMVELKLSAIRQRPGPNTHPARHTKIFLVSFLGGIFRARFGSWEGKGGPQPSRLCRAITAPQGWSMGLIVGTTLSTSLLTRDFDHPQLGGHVLALVGALSVVLVCALRRCPAKLNLPPLIKVPHHVVSV